MTRDTGPGGRRRTVPVEPPIHVETFAQHCSLTWKAAGLARFIETVRSLDGVPGDSTAVMDATDIAGRQQCRLSALDPSRDTVTYVRVEPPASWTLSWERRTWPVVVLTGTPTPELCRSLHLATTECRVWDGAALEALDGMTGHLR